MILKQLNPQEENKSKIRPENYKLGQGGLIKRGHCNKSCSGWEERLLKFSSDHMGGHAATQQIIKGEKKN